MNIYALDKMACNLIEVNHRPVNHTNFRLNHTINGNFHFPRHKQLLFKKRHLYEKILSSNAHSETIIAGDQGISSNKTALDGHKYTNKKNLSGTKMEMQKCKHILQKNIGNGKMEMRRIL